MAEHNDLGQQGEKLAVAYLDAKGYTILATNWRSGRNELDIVAQHNDIIVFVEVKKRHSKAFREPWEAVNRKKQRNIILAANIYLKKSHSDLEPRFDIVSIVQDGQKIEIEHIEQAFWPMA